MGHTVWVLAVLLTLLLPPALAAPPPAPPPPPVQAAISALHITAHPDTPSTDLALTATIQVYAGGYIDLPLGLDQLILWRATLDGRPVPLPPAPGSRRLTADLAPGTHTLRAEGLLVSLSPEARLSLPPSTPTVLHLDAAGLDVSVEGGVALGRDEVALLPTGVLSMAWKPETPPPPRPRRLVVESAVGISVEAGGTEGQARLHYQAINGPVDSVTLRLSGPLDLIEASGPLVRDSQRQGDRLVVSLVEPQEGDFGVDVRFRGPPPQGGVSLFVPEADRATGWVSLLAGEEGYLEQQALHLEPVLPDDVPAWGQGLAPGSLLAAWHYDAGTMPSLSVKAQRWETIESPGTLVDEATLKVAHTDHGRTLTRARLMVRNDRRQYLGVTLPPQSTLLVARVAGSPVEVVRHGDQILVPLEKSIETLTGLISFPVEVSWLSQTPVWRRRGEMALVAPTFDAPVTQLRWSLLLPPGAEARRVIGQSAQVVRQEAPPPTTRPPTTPLPADDPLWSQLAMIDPARFRLLDGSLRSPSARPRPTTAVEYAPEIVDEKVVDDEDKERSVELWTRAYSAYKGNDFEQAEALLEQSLQWDAGNSSSQALLDNVVVLQGQSDASGAQAERIKAMARSRSSGAEVQQRVLLEEAESLYRAGDMDRAIEQYNQALVVTDQLALLEDSNANLQKASSSQLRAKLKKVEEERDSRSSILDERTPPPPPLLESTIEEVVEEEGWGENELARVSNNEIHVYDFEDVVVDGELVVPDAVQFRPTDNITTLLRDNTNANSPDTGRFAEFETERGPINTAAPTSGPVYPAATEIEFDDDEIETYAREDVQPTPPVRALEREYLEYIPAGRSYQSTVTMAAGVSGSSSNANGLDNVQVSMDIGRGVLGGLAGGRGSRSQDVGGKDDAYGPVQQEVSLVGDVMLIPEGVTSSQWIVLVPDVGLTVELERQLLGSDEGVGARVRYRLKRGG